MGTFMHKNCKSKFKWLWIFFFFIYVKCIKKTDYSTTVWKYFNFLFVVVVHISAKEAIASADFFIRHFYMVCNVHINSIYLLVYEFSVFKNRKSNQSYIYTRGQFRFHQIFFFAFILLCDPRTRSNDQTFIASRYIFMKTICLNVCTKEDLVFSCVVLINFY